MVSYKMKRMHLFLFLLLMVSGLAEAAITVSIDREPVHVNESFQLFFEASESPDDDPDFSPLQQYFDILNTSQSSQISIINGDYKRSIKWTLQLMPKQVGDIIVPAIKFGDDKTEPFQVSVKPAAQSSAGSKSGLIFELSVDRDKVAVQGQVIVSMRLMSNVNISAYQFGELITDSMDVVIEPLDDVKRYQTRVGDQAFLVLEQKHALFPQQSGRLTIPPVLGEVRVATQSRSIFDPFQNQGEIRRVRSAGLNIDVTGIEPQFSGQHWLPSSNVRLSEVWQQDLDNLVAGEPVTRTLILTADGLTAAQLPELKQGVVDNLKQYPDQAVQNDQRSDKGIVGVVQQKIALIPTAAGNYTLPEIAIPWWNIRTGQQEIASIPARTIKVTAGAGVSEPASTSQPPVAITEDATNPVEVVPVNNPFWIWFSLFLACGWLASGLYWWFSGRPASSAKSDDQPKQTSLGKASKILEKACLQNNALAAREALLPWANALDAGCRFVNLNEMTQVFGEPLKGALKELNQSLYSAGSEEWNGEDLWRVCKDIAESSKVSEKTEVDGLQALNP